MQHRTFGFAEIPLPTPDNFLKKDEGIRQRYERPKTSHVRCTARHPPVPKHNEKNDFMIQSMQNLSNDKNFKLVNIKRAKSANLRNPPGPKCFEQTPPVYINSPKYGRIPKYLKKLNQQLKHMEMEKLRKEKEEQGKQTPNIRIIGQEEKGELLAGLNHNWNLLHQQYSKMPLLIDTVPKQIRKTKLEQQLKDLEYEICRLNTNTNCIYILPD